MSWMTPICVQGLPSKQKTVGHKSQMKSLPTPQSFTLPPYPPIYSKLPEEGDVSLIR